MARQPTETRRNTRAPLIEGATSQASAANGPTQPPLRSNPANENDPSTAMMMRRLRRSPSYDGIWISLIISLVWAIGWFFGYKDVLLNGQVLSLWGYMQGLAWLVLPPVTIVAIAFNMWRSQQLRITSEVLMQQAMRLINPQDIATEGLTSIAQSVRQEVDMLVGGVEHALQRASALEEIVHKEVSAVERAFGSNEERIRSLVNGLETQRAALLQTSTQVAADAQPMLQRLEANTHGLTQVVNVALTTFGRIEEGLKSSTTDLSRTIDDVSARTAETTQAIGQQSQQFERISTMLLSDFRGFSGDLQVQMQTLSTTASGLGNESRQFNSDMKDMEQNIAQLMRQNTDVLASTHAAMQVGMQNLTSDYVEKLQGVRGEILNQFNDSSRHMITELDSANLRFHENFNTSSSQLFAQMDQTSTHLVAQLGASGSGVIGAIQQSAEEYSKALTEVSARQETLTSTLQGSLNRTTSLLAQEMQSAGTNVNELLVNTSSTIAAHLKESSDVASRQMQNAGFALTQEMQSAGTNVNELLVSTSSTIAAHLKESSDIVSRQMQDSGFALAQNMEKSSGDLTDKLITISGEFVHKLGNAREGLLTSFLGASGELISKLEDTSITIFDRLHSTNNEMTGRIDRVSSELADHLQSTNADVTERLIRVSSDLTGRLQSTNSDVTERLERVSSELTERFDTTSSQINDRLNFTASEIEQQFNEATDRLDLAAKESTTRLDSHGKRFVESLDGASGRIFSDLGNARDAFAEGLGETTLQISGRFEQETGLLLNRIDRSVGEFNTAAKTSSDKLQEASGIFAKHMSGTQGLLADQLASAATDIDQRLENVSLQLTGRLETTGNKISERLDDVSSLVDKSMDKFNLEMEHMLTSRRDMLDGLVNDANRRATEVDKTMTNYMTMIEESLSAAEERARHLGRIVADQSGAALANLEEQLRKLETNSGGQIAQAARALREQHERALSNMNEMLSSTASDFQQTAQDMRITAQQVVKDIDVARGELKRAVIDLPEETRSNADAMRRVVADQIGALNALADVVRKQSGSLDYSTPSYAAPRPAISAPRFEASAPVAVLARPEPAAIAAPRLASLGREIESANAKLNVSARDVVEAIEGQLPRDLERRYANSDKGAYAKRLFESRSRKLVKALESRYSEERLLRSRVQAYNRLFEKLLDTIAGTDGADEVMEQVLASDQGRIYVMLAEIAGRMPNQS